MTYLLILGLISAASSRTWLSPYTSYELLNISNPTSSCRDGTEEEKNDSEIANYGKASTFSLRGIYRCERRLFEYGERNSFLNLVADTVPGHADHAARRIKNVISDSKESKNHKSTRLIIDVSSEIENVIPMVKIAYQTAISQRIETINVLRHKEIGAHNFYRLKVTVQRVDDPDLILQTKLFWHRNGTATEVPI